MRILSVKFGRPRYTGPPPQFRRPTHPEHLNLCRGGQPQGRSLRSGTVHPHVVENGISRRFLDRCLRSGFQLVQILQGLSCHLAGFLSFFFIIIRGNACACGQQNCGENGGNHFESHCRAPPRSAMTLATERLLRLLQGHSYGAGFEGYLPFSLPKVNDILAALKNTIQLQL
jgi:hypothetical protein